ARSGKGGEAGGGCLAEPGDDVGQGAGADDGEPGGGRVAELPGGHDDGGAPPAGAGGGGVSHAGQGPEAAVVAQVGVEDDVPGRGGGYLAAGGEDGDRDRQVAWRGRAHAARAGHYRDGR